jgi:glutathione S-transferase
MTHLTLVSHALCPYVQRAAIALAEKGVAFDRVDIDLDAKPDWFLAISPLGKVPLLRVARPGEEEAVLFESSVIAEWIDETQGSPRLHPEDPTTRARERAWMEFGNAVLADIWVFESSADAAAFERARTALEVKLQRAEDALGEGPWFAGTRFGLVDAVFAPAFRFLDQIDRVTDLGLPHLPKVAAWRTALAERPSVRNAVGDDFADLFRAFLERHHVHLLSLEPVA